MRRGVISPPIVVESALSQPPIRFLCKTAGALVRPVSQEARLPSLKRRVSIRASLMASTLLGSVASLSSVRVMTRLPRSVAVHRERSATGARADRRPGAHRSLLLRAALAEARTVADPAGNEKLAKGVEGRRRRRARDDAAAAAILAVAEGVRRGDRPRRTWRYRGVSA